MQQRNTNLIVGIVIILALGILIGGVRFLSETKFRESTIDVSAIFDNVGTLTEGDPVKINGVKKGKVKDIRLKGHKVEVVMAINKEVQITRNSRIVIQNIGLMGERMIGIQLGTGEPLHPGEIMDGEFDSGIAEAMGMLGEVLTQVQETVNDLREIVQRTIGTDEFNILFKDVTDRLDNTTRILNRMVNQNKDALQGSIDDLHAIAQDVRAFLSTNKSRLENSVANIDEISSQTKAMLVKADKIIEDLEEIVSRLNSDNSSVGRILNDTAFVEDIKLTVHNADSLIRQIRKKGIKVGLW